MRAFPDFSDMSSEFWAFVKFVSEMLGYTVRREGVVQTYTEGEIIKLCRKKNTYVSNRLLRQVVRYFDMRADLLNNFAEEMLMDAETARAECEPLLRLHTKDGFYCKLPLNKQKGDMKQIAYFTAIINILAERTIRECIPDITELGFDDDPRGLVYIWDNERALIGASSRRFDGAYPSIENPRMVWEIKEYYYATTFGSRVADGVYETQLDGYEFKELLNRTGRKVYHVLFVDAYRTWWIQGKSYLCRIIDSLNMGLVDEVIIGREVFTRWPELLKSML